MGMILDPYGGPFLAHQMVADAAGRYESRIESYITQMQYAVNSLANVRLEPYNLNVEYNVAPWLPHFQRPTRPTTPTFREVDVSTPEAPELEPVVARELGDAPEEPDFSFVSYAPPTAPNLVLPTAPSNVNPALIPIEVPDQPAFVMPDAPELIDIQIPDLPQIVLPDFDAIRPNPDIAVPTDGALEWQEVPYTSVLLDDLGAKLRGMVETGLALDPAVEQAIYNRGRVRADKETAAMLQQIDEDMSSRGLIEPNGILTENRKVAIFEGRSKKAEFNRDITIRQAELAIEGVKYAVGQGIQLESNLIQAHAAAQERAMRAAIFVREWSITRVNALVAIENIRRDLYLADAQVWKTRIEGELAKLEILKAEIDAQRLVSEVNKNLVDLYEARSRAVRELIEAYKANVEAAKVRGEINVQRLQGAELIVRRYTSEVEAYGKGWDAYKTRVEASQGSLKYAELLGSLFNVRMQGFKTRGEAYRTEATTRLESQQQELALFQSRLQGADQELRAQLGELDGQVRSFLAQTHLYQADGAIAAAESSALDRAVQLRIAEEKNRVDVEVAEGQINSQHLQKNAELVLAALKAIADNYAQLLASAQSGVNYGASLSGNMSTGVSLSRSQSWTGETTDHDGTGF